jgi:UDP-glucose 4-epimerase
LLAQGHTVRILDNLSTGKRANVPAHVEVIEGGIADPETDSRTIDGADGCFHLAAIASVELGNQDWLGTHNVNLTGAIAILDAARRANSRGPIPVVYASSAAVYGNNRMCRSIRARHEHHARPTALISSGANSMPSWPVSSIRFRPAGSGSLMSMGPARTRILRTRASSRFSASVFKAGEPISIFGDGLQTRDFVHVSDVVRALLAGMSRASTEAHVYNVCTGQPTTILELVDKIGECLGMTVKPVFAAPRKGETRESVGNPVKASHDLGFKARISLLAGLKRTIDAL